LIGAKSPAALCADIGFVAGRKKRGFCGLPSEPRSLWRSEPRSLGAMSLIGAKSLAALCADIGFVTGRKSVVFSACG